MKTSFELEIKEQDNLLMKMVKVILVACNLSLATLFVAVLGMEMKNAEPTEIRTELNDEKYLKTAG